MNSKLEKIYRLNDYLIDCKLADPRSKKTEFTRQYLNYSIFKLLEERIERKKPNRFLTSLLSLIF